MHRQNDLVWEGFICVNDKAENLPFKLFGVVNSLKSQILSQWLRTEIENSLFVTVLCVCVCVCVRRHACAWDRRRKTFFLELYYTYRDSDASTQACAHVCIRQKQRENLPSKYIINSETSTHEWAHACACVFVCMRDWQTYYTYIENIQIHLTYNIYSPHSCWFNTQLWSNFHTASYMQNKPRGRPNWDPSGSGSCN